MSEYACDFWQERWRQTANLRIGYRDAGAGTVVVLLHGISSGAGSWAGQAALLDRQCRLIAWDAPGYGHSDTLSKAEPHAADYATALHELVESLELESFYLVGHSLGAMMAAAYAAAHPSRVRGLLLADPAQGYAKADFAERERVRQTRVRLLAELGRDEYVKRRSGVLLRPQCDAGALAVVRASMQRLRLDGFSQANWMLANDDIWRYLPDWQGPLHVVCGDADAITPPAGVAELAQRMSAPCSLLANAGHASYLDAPEGFASAVSNLLGATKAGIVSSRSKHEFSH
jgi:pimeloyl-ACP methyl ester carboxylesterase